MTPGAVDGLQASRTMLSWRRTVASAGAAAGIALHHTLTGVGSQRTTTFLVAAVVASTLTLTVAAGLRTRRLHARCDPASPVLVHLTASAVLLAAAGALVEALLHG